MNIIVEGIGSTNLMDLPYCINTCIVIKPKNEVFIVLGCSKGNIKNLVDNIPKYISSRFEIETVSDFAIELKAKTKTHLITHNFVIKATKLDGDVLYVTEIHKRLVLNYCSARKYDNEIVAQKAIDEIKPNSEQGIIFEIMPFKEGDILEFVRNSDKINSMTLTMVKPFGLT